ncbi:hypothetical protein CUC15_17175 [Oceanobacillus zhaokaii]|uniref:Uncharacterized protein n=1 Tax=Oceanobacillus zhaokaii TaxID=2052660 RepID=A0A345PKN0_9BACI|nr:hypothetical protein CUC15_17175 [Oceanobacillus zhaokaii]
MLNLAGAELPTSFTSLLRYYLFPHLTTYLLAATMELLITGCVFYDCKKAYQNQDGIPEI